MSLAGVVDAVLEAPVAPSFTRIGHDIRSRLEDWRPVGSYDLGGRTVLVTGATSGIGRCAAELLVAAGARVVIVGRDPDRTRAARDEIAAAGRGEAVVAVADMSDLAAVRALAAEVIDSHPEVDTVVHNAGALLAERRESADGIEMTVATQVVGPFLLNHLLRERLSANAPARVITMSSGGMYTAPLTVDELEMGDDYRGSEQYARAKRAQVTLNEMWAMRTRDEGIAFHALHPGWVDTPGVHASLPTFGRVVGPLLRPPAQGADTLVWLVADDGAPIATTGRFWHDRRTRPIHRLSRTRESDTPERRRRLWAWCAERAGVEDDTPT